MTSTADVTDVIDALGQASGLEYDERNLVIRQRDRLNRITSYDYDAQGRLGNVSFPDGDSVRVARDVLGRVTSVEDNGSRVDYTYDAVDRLVRERTTNLAGTHEVAYAWDALDRLVARTVNGVDTTSYFYDAASRLTAVEYRDTLTTYTWDAAGRLTHKTLANGIHQNLTWDDASRLTRIEYRSSDASLIEAIDYQYDANGQRIRKAHGQPSVAETPMQAEYDAADRMTRVTLFPGSDKEATYRLEYDREGNLIRRSSTTFASDSTTYNWDGRGRLVGIVGPTVTASFRYDALDRRIERTINGQTLRAIYDGMQMIGEVASGVVDPTYLTGLQIDEMLVRHTAAGARTYLTDALGSVIAQTDEDQKPINWYSYSPYGEVAITGDDERNPVQYTGRDNDGTGLYYYRGRYYDPVLKRFISEDPAGFRGGVNGHAYVLGNPISHVDPLGLWSVSVDLYVGVGGGVTIGYNENTGGWFGGGRLGLGGGGGFNLDLLDKGPEAETCSRSGTKIGTFGTLAASAGLLGANYSFEGGIYTSGGSFSKDPSLNGTVNGLGGKGISFGWAMGMQAIGF